MRRRTEDMTTTEDKPVDREAWRRLLDGEDDGPPELTDARIRAKARQAIAPRAGRWWLPASLAASLLLAVVLVQRQTGRPGAPAVVSESDYATAPANSPAPPRQDAEMQDAAPPALEAPAPASARLESRQVAAPTTAIAQRRAEATTRAERDQGFVPAPPPVVPPPLVDLPATSDARATSAAPAEAPAAGTSTVGAADAEAKSKEDLGEIAVTGNRRREGSLESSTPVTQATGAEVTAQGAAHSGGLLKSGVAERTPEEWYAEIEKLRAAGKKREAKRELKKLEEAHPGWLDEHHPAER